MTLIDEDYQLFLHRVISGRLEVLKVLVHFCEVHVGVFLCVG